MENQIGQNSVNQPVSAPEKPKTNYVVIGAVVLASFIIFGFGGYSLGKQSAISLKPMGNKNQIIPSVVPQASSPIPIINPSLSPTNANIPGWKNYTISSVNLSFSIPGNWAATQSLGSDSIVVVTPYSKNDAESEAGFVPMQISVDTATDANGNIHFDTIQQAKIHYLKSLNSDAKIKDNFLIGGKSAFTIEGSLLGPGPGEGNFMQFTFIQLNNKVLVVQLGNRDIQDTFAQILSTFKFAT